MPEQINGQTKATDTAHPAPWYESNLLWVPVTVGVGIVLTVVGAMKHDLRWLLLVAWLCFVIAACVLGWRFRKSVWIAAGAVLLIGIALIGMNYWLRPAETKAALNRNEKLPVTEQPKDKPEAAPPARQDSAKRPDKVPQAKPNQSAGGDNSRISGGLTQGPGSIAQIGGTGNNATIINNGPEPRRLSPVERTSLSMCLAQNPGEVDISAVSGDAEAYNFAKDWAYAFGQAGWAIKDKTIHTVEVVNGVWVGVRVGFHGSRDAETKIATYETKSPEGVAVSCISGIKTQGELIPYPDMAPKTLQLIVASRPQ